MASTVGLLLPAVVYGIFTQTLTLSDVMRSQVTLNKNARETFIILRDHGINSAEVEIHGLRGRGQGAVDLTVNTYRFDNPALNNANEGFSRLQIGTLLSAEAPQTMVFRLQEAP